MSVKSTPQRWLYRPHNRRKLWWAFAVVLAATLIAQLRWPVHGHFGFDGWFSFNALFGFITCTAMVVAAKILGFAIKRQETYYRVDDNPDPSLAKTTHPGDDNV